MQSERERYTALGYDVIPLRAGTKKPIAADWTHRAPAEQWQRAPRAANIGIRAGGALGVAVLDLDEKNRAGTVAAGLAFLDGLGMTPGMFPYVETPSKGGHVYLRLTGAPAGNTCDLAADLAGEFRFGPGSQTVAPPSMLATGNVYRLMAGDFASIPAVTYSDILPLLGTVTTTADTPALAPMPGAKADKLLATALTMGTPGRRNVTGFWLARMLRDGGASMRQAEAVMREYHAGVLQPPGMDAYTVKEALDSLRTAYSRTGHATYGGQPAYDELAAAYLWAESYAWPGRTGRTDKIAFQVHIKAGWRAGATVWDVSVREVAEKTGTGTATGVSINKRLVNAGILHRTVAAAKTDAASYELSAWLRAECQNRSHKQLGAAEPNRTIDSSNNRQVDGSGRGQVTLVTSAAAAGALATPTDAPAVPPYCLCDRDWHNTRSLDVFRWRALGPSAADVFDALATGPGTLAELAGRARMTKRTARRALYTLREYGLATQDAGTWHRLEADLEAVAASLGTAGQGETQRQKHAEERRKWRTAEGWRHRAITAPMPSSELAQAERILAGRQTRAEHAAIEANRKPPSTPVHDATGSRIVGVVVGAILQKRIQGSKHFGTQPPSIRLDMATVKEATAAGAEYVAVTDTETGTVYRALLADFGGRGLPVTVKGVNQWALPLAFCGTDSRQATPEPAQAEHIAAEQPPASTSTTPPVTAALPSESTSTTTPPPSLAGVVRELAGRMTAPKRTPAPWQWNTPDERQARKHDTPLKPWTDATEAEHAENFRAALAIIAEWEHEQSAALAAI